METLKINESHGLARTLNTLDKMVGAEVRLEKQNYTKGGEKFDLSQSRFRLLGYAVSEFKMNGHAMLAVELYAEGAGIIYSRFPISSEDRENYAFRLETVNPVHLVSAASYVSSII